MLVDFSSSVAYSRSRIFRKSICVQEKVPTNIYIYEYALTYTRLEDNLIRSTPAVLPGIRHNFTPIRSRIILNQIFSTRQP